MPELHRTHFRPALQLTFSSLGLGTYLGDADDPTDSLLENAMRQVLRRGVNVIDTAIVYRQISLLEAAASRGLAVLTSASTGQGRLALGLSKADASLFGGLETEPQRALQVVRSLAEVTTALVGMKQREHIEENLRPTGLPTMLPAQAQRFFDSGS